MIRRVQSPSSWRNAVRASITSVIGYPTSMRHSLPVAPQASGWSTTHPALVPGATALRFSIPKGPLASCSNSRSSNRGRAAQVPSGRVFAWLFRSTGTLGVSRGREVDLVHHLSVVGCLHHRERHEFDAPRPVQLNHHLPGGG